MDETKLLELLVRLGYVKREEALQAQRERGKEEDIISTLLRLGFINDTKLMDFYQKYMPNKLWRGKIEEVNLPENIREKLPEELLKKHIIAPIKYEDDKLYVLTINPFNQSAINELRFRSKINTIVPYLATKKSIEDVLAKLYPAVERIVESMEIGEEVEIEMEELDISPQVIEAEAGEAPIVKLANFLMAEAVNLGASDIHVEPQEKKLS
ncbi:MAG: type II/IV secretion system protein, partial [Acidobacteria bacterium]